MRKEFSIAPVTVVSRSKISLTISQNGTSTISNTGISANNIRGQTPARKKDVRNSGELRNAGIAGKIELRKLAESVAFCEGWNSKGSIAQQNLNACNIRKRCTAGMSKGFGKCKTAEDGFKLCETTLKWYIKRDKTLAQMIRYFSPKSDGNNPVTHASCIAKKAGIDKNIKLNLVIK